MSEKSIERDLILVVKGIGIGSILTFLLITIGVFAEGVKEGRSLRKEFDMEQSNKVQD